MPKTLFSALTLSTLAALSLQAQSEVPKPSWTVTGNAGLYTDYRFRGFTQTAYKPSFQGGFDVSHRSGFYFGNWNANVEQSLYRGASLEIDVYGGCKFTLGPVGFDLGALTCRYPTRANTGDAGEARLDEVYLGLSYGIVTAKYSHQLSNYFGLGDGTGVDTKDGSYLDLGAFYSLGSGWGLNAHYGHQTIRHATAPSIGLKADSVDDYKIGATKELKGWVVDVAWIGTSRKDLFTTGASVPEAGGKGALVAGLTKNF